MKEVLVARAAQRGRDGLPVQDVGGHGSGVHLQRRVAPVRRAPRVLRDCTRERQIR